MGSLVLGIPDDGGAALVRYPHTRYLADLVQGGTGRLHHCSAQRRPVLFDQARHRAVRAQAQLTPGFDRPVRPDHARSYGTATYVDDEDADGPHPLARRSCQSGRTLLIPLAGIKA